MDGNYVPPEERLRQPGAVDHEKLKSWFSVHHILAYLLIVFFVFAVVAVAYYYQVSNSAPDTPSPAHHPVAQNSKKTIDENAAGQTIALNVGDTLKLDLHSSYWQVSSRNPIVISQTGQVFTPDSTIKIPGSGAGLQETTFQAMKIGTTSVTATRTTCGEALKCVPPQTFNVNIIVK